MLSETIPPRNKLRPFGGGIAIPVNRTGWPMHATHPPFDKRDNLVLHKGPATVPIDPGKGPPGTYVLFVYSPNANTIDPPSGLNLAEVLRGYTKGNVNPGYTSPVGMSDHHTWIDVPDPDYTSYFNERALRAGAPAGSWHAAVNVIEPLEDYEVYVLSYGQGASSPEVEYVTHPSVACGSMADIIHAINSMGEFKIASRLKYLASEEIAEEGDIPVSLQVCAAFLEFFTQLTNNAHLNLTCAKGWLCAEWDFPDDSSVIVWFMERDAARVTVFDREDNLVDINAGQQVRDRSIIMENLERSGYFSWRNKNLSNVSSQPATTSPAITPSGSGEMTDDHLQQLS